MASIEGMDNLFAYPDPDCELEHSSPRPSSHHLGQERPGQPTFWRHACSKHIMDYYGHPGWIVLSHDEVGLEHPVA